MSKVFLLIGSGLCGLTVAIGAFGAHALKKILEANGRVDTFETAVKYQFYHALGLILVAFMMQKIESTTLNWSGYSFILGILIFSGSLYVLSITGLRWLGAITPIGGVFFIVGWTILFWTIFKKM